MGWIAGGFFVVVSVWLARYVRSVRKGARHAEGTPSQWWTAGGGGHGEGANPPLVIGNEDWDPDRRIP